MYRVRVKIGESNPHIERASPSFIDIQVNEQTRASVPAEGDWGKAGDVSVHDACFAQFCLRYKPYAKMASILIFFCLYFIRRVSSIQIFF